MEKFPANNGISPSRISLVEETLAEQSERAIIEDAVSEEDRRVLMRIVGVVIMLNSVFLRNGTSASFMQNITRKRLRYGIKLSLIPILLAVTLMPLSTRLSDRFRFSGNLSARIQIMISLISFLIGLSGIRMEFDSLRQISPGSKPELIETLTQRVSSFQFLSRLILTDGLSKLALVFLPLVDVRKVWITLRRRIYPSPLSRDSSTCSHCHTERVVLPRRAQPCGDIYCYYCSKVVEKNTVCTRCREHVSCWEPFIS